MNMSQQIDTLILRYFMLTHRVSISKMSELEAVADGGKPDIMAITDSWANADIPDATLDA